MDLTADFKTFQDLVQTSLIDVTRSATQVSNQDLSFHRSSSQKLSRSLDRQNAHLLRLTNKLLKAATQDTQLKTPVLQSLDDVEDNWRGIIDIVDGLLEKADSALDEFSGVVKPQDAARQETEPPSSKPAKSFRSFDNIAQKPQKFFDRQVNNSDPSPFKPLLQTKPHALVPLEESIGGEESGYRHPYSKEIEAYNYPSSVYRFAPPIPFTSPDDSKPIFVDTEEGVQEMLEELRTASEIAIDIEHNELRSYVGMVCLMQISTRRKDWIIDTLRPWREKLQILNEVFADPKILKVLHGASMDIIWLQRDLGLYIVGLFDTFHAACALQFPGKGLKHLLLKFANFEAQKQYQMADWRIRPLPDYLVDYARSDTHYLLTIYDHMRNMLVQGSSRNVNLVDYVLAQSKREALQVYTRSLYDVETGGGSLGWFGIFTSRSVNFSQEQFAVFRALHAWRDSKARELDEGIQFIMPNRVLWMAAESMPTSVWNFHQTCRGTSKLVSDNIGEIVDVIKAAKIEGQKDKPVQEILRHCEEVLGPIQRRHFAKEKKEAQSVYQGLGATLQQLAANGEVSTPTTPNNEEKNTSTEVKQPIAVRTSASALWGHVAPQYQQFAQSQAAATDALAAILPLATFTMERADGAAQLSTSKTDVLSTPLPTRPQVKAAPLERSSPQTPEVFTLNELSHGKKRTADEAELEAQVASSSPADASLLEKTMASEDQSEETSPQVAAAGNELDGKRLTKKQKKAERKARREAERLAAEAAAQNIQPFDYASAASLLDPDTLSPAQTNGGTQKGNNKKAMNPYAKALDTSTGARRGKMGKELAGKSMTFNS